MQNNELINNVHNALVKEKCVSTTQSVKARRVIEDIVASATFKYDYDSDFVLINRLTEEYSEMFFDEKLTKRALSYFRNGHLGGNISDSDFEDTLQSITTSVYQLLSDQYKTRISMYLMTEDEDVDSGVISYVYLHARRFLFLKVVDYNKALTTKK